MTSIQYNMSVIFENNKLKMKESVLTEEELQTYTELPNDDWLWNENENENENPNPNPNVTDELSSPINDTLAIIESMERDKKKRDYETLDHLFAEDLHLNGHMIWWKPIDCN